MVKWIACVCAPLFVALVSRGEAQVNIEKLRSDEAKSGAAGAVEFDLRARSGNVEVWEVGIEAQLGRRRQRGSTLLIARGELGWEGGERYSSEGLFHLRQGFKKSDGIWPEVFAQIDYDKARLLEFRGLVGGGLRLRIYQGEGVRCWWGTAYMLEHERLDAAEDMEAGRVVTVHRWSNYLTIRAEIGERVRGLGAVYAQPRFDAWGDVRMLGDARLEVELGGPLSLVVSSHARYDSRPPGRIESLDVRLNSGLKIEF